ncbi:MAG: deoxyribose-phosphate aldolase [Bacillota bacterium]|jgi:deoxyribose-phosphate aldolase
MDKKEILQHIDHTNLQQTATESDIAKLCDEAIAAGCASVCIPSSYVGFAKRYVKGRMKICTVVGFPNGYATTAAKVVETVDAVIMGADEIDMVINIGWLKDKKYHLLADEIAQVRNACKKQILKVIIETCFLTEDEKIKMCEIITEAKADYIKTSTGFGGGAVVADIKLFAEHIGKDIKIKAAGGIRDFAAAEEFIAAGADRIGSSSLAKF